MNSEPIQPVRTPLVGPEVQQTRPAHPDERRDRRRDRAKPRPRPQPLEAAEQGEQDPPPAGDDEDAEDQHKIDVYT